MTDDTQELMDALWAVLLPASLGCSVSEIGGEEIEAAFALLVRLGHPEAKAQLEEHERIAAQRHWLTGS